MSPLKILPDEPEGAVALDWPKRDGVVGGLVLPPNMLVDRASVVELGSKMLLRFADGSEGTVVSRFRLPIRLLLPALPLPRLPAGGLLDGGKNDILSKKEQANYSMTRQALTASAVASALTIL